MSFVRMQEFYESPKFKGKYFTLEEFIDYWSLNYGKGAFTYPNAWNGFNLPGEVFESWKKKFIHEHNDILREREISVLTTVFELMDKDECDGKYYIIAVNEENKVDMNEAIEHETAHAFYYLYPEYRKSCDKLLKKLGKKQYKNDKEMLLKMGYCKKVINDELQAYYSCGSGNRFENITEFIDNFNTFKNSRK
jgi:hypothetical protein